MSQTKQHFLASCSCVSNFGYFFFMILVQCTCTSCSAVLTLVAQPVTEQNKTPNNNNEKKTWREIFWVWQSDVKNFRITKYLQKYSQPDSSRNLAKGFWKTVEIFGFFFKTSGSDVMLPKTPSENLLWKGDQAVKSIKTCSKSGLVVTLGNSRSAKLSELPSEHFPPACTRGSLRLVSGSTFEVKLQLS